MVQALLISELIIFFADFFNSIERHIIDRLHEYDLLDDKKIKHKDTSKIFNTILLREIYKELKSTNCNCIFILDDLVIHRDTETAKLFNMTRVKTHVRKTFRILRKHFPRNFNIIKHPFENLRDDAGLLEDMMFDMSHKVTNKILTKASYNSLLKELETCI